MDGGLEGKRKGMREDGRKRTVRISDGLGVEKRKGKGMGGEGKKLKVPVDGKEMTRTIEERVWTTDGRKETRRKRPGMGIWEGGRMEEMRMESEKRREEAGKGQGGRNYGSSISPNWRKRG